MHHIFSLGFILIGSFSIAQEEETVRIQDLVDNSEFQAAYSELSALQETCDQNCAKVDFTWGYFYQKIFSAFPDSISAADQAVNYYRNALSRSPADVASRNNLALLLFNQGDLDQAIQLLQEAPENTKINFRMVLGKMYQQQANYNLALDQYRLLLDENRNGALRAISDLVSHEYFPSDTVFRYCSSMIATNQQELAKRSLIGALSAEFDLYQRINEPMLVWWVHMVSQSPHIRSSIKKYLSGQWRSPQVSELRTVIEGPAITIDLIDWWRKDEKVYSYGSVELSPREVMSSLLVGLGKEERLAGNVEKAESYLDVAMKLITRGHVESYLSVPGRISDVFFSVAEELSILYTKYQETLDPDNRKFERLERQMFGGKGAAYLSFKKSSIYKFHLTLGLIYAYRQQWEGSRFKNAHFQLESAVDKASEGTNTAFLSKLNAQGYKIEGERDKALEWYAKSSVDYLTYDDQPSANAVLSEAINSEALSINTDQMYNYAARYALVNDKLTQALYLSERSVAFNQNFTNLAARTDVLKALGNTQEAEQTYQLALDLPGVSSAMLYNYGVLLMAQKRTEEAIEIFNTLNERDSESWQAAHGLAMGFSAKGDYKTALKQVEIAMSKEIPNEKKQQFRWNIRRLKDGNDFNSEIKKTSDLLKMLTVDFN